MVDVSLDWSMYAAATGAIVALGMYLHMARARAIKRTVELEAAAKAMREHYDALDRALGDPALPEELEMLLVASHQLVVDRDCAVSVMQNAFSNPGATPPENAVDLMPMIQGLRSHRPDLVDACMKAVSSSIMVALLRWPENAAEFERLAAEMWTDRKKQVSLASSITRRPKDNDGGNGPMITGGAVPAC